MSRDLSKSLKAQKNVEKKSESKFGHLQEEIQEKQNANPMIKLTATITKRDWDYLHNEALKRCQERGKIVNISQVLREIIKEHMQFNNSQDN
jgi:hypothetical protein